ncbi:hypothetical protein DSUL_30072 [Desulfovibrionales bacterium]
MDLLVFALHVYYLASTRFRILHWVSTGMYTRIRFQFFQSAEVTVAFARVGQGIFLWLGDSAGRSR